MICDVFFPRPKAARVSAITDMWRGIRTGSRLSVGVTLTAAHARDLVLVYVNQVDTPDIVRGKDAIEAGQSLGWVELTLLSCILGS